MTPLIFASAMALFRATLSSPDPLFPTDGSAHGPLPVNGVWAGLPADCAAPTSIDLSTWPKCAQPVGFLDGQIAVLEKPSAKNSVKPGELYSIARTKFWVVKATDAAPAIVQVDIPILFNHSTIYIAIKPDAVDADGRFIAAVGWPVSCPPTPAPKPTPGLQTEGGHCTASTAAAVRLAAAVQPEPSKTYRLVRINPESPPSAPPPAAATSPSTPAPSTTPPSTLPPSTLPPEDAEPSSVAPPEGSTPSTPPTAAPGDVTATPLPPPASPN
jgi:hypothetical protein